MRGIDWAKSHPNALNSNDPNDALYLDASKLDFGHLNVKNFPLEVGKKGNVNLFDFVKWHSSTSRSTTYVLGNTQMTLVDTTGTVQLYPDKFDWDYHSYKLEKEGHVPDNKRDKLIMTERARGA